MVETTVVMVIDGLDPEYLGCCSVPNLLGLARRGFMVEAKALLPTVTNVNNVSLVTASYPETHGITSNYWLNRHPSIVPPGRGGYRGVYLESAEYIKTETMFQRAAQQGARSLLVTAKDKLRRLLGNGATLSISSESASGGPAWVISAVGEPPPIYSLEVNGWTVDAARFILSREPYDLVYLATTDYAMHTYAPQQQESSDHLALLDESIGKLMESLPEVQILITADHGMSSKTRMLHLPAALGEHGIQAQAVPVIKDRYTVHHSNLGGCIYIYLESRDRDRALSVLREIDGVDEALPREEAASKYRLMADRIGDIMVLGAADVVFGDPQEVTLPARLRSHGSKHEDRVPLIGYGGDFDGFEFRENKDIGRYIFERILG